MTIKMDNPEKLTA